MNYRTLAIVVIALHTTALCAAKNADSVFRAQQVIIFSDDFGEDSAGHFPKKWKVDCGNCSGRSIISKSNIAIAGYAGDTSFVVIKPVEGKESWIQPLLQKMDYLPDSFSFEYDFFLETKSASCNFYFKYCDQCFCEVFYMHNKNNYKFILDYGGYRDVITDRESRPEYYFAEQTIHNGCDVSNWHHFALNYYQGAVSCYIDNEFLFHSSICNTYTPKQLALHCNHGTGAVRYANLRLATGNFISQNAASEFAKMLTQKKLVTHAILFDANSTVIRLESIPFIQKFALFLKANPRIDIEIDGYTNSDGTDAHNIELSRNRATQIKKQLTSLGVSANRLSSKGFGAVKPIDTNATSEGKAANRRVEFIVR